MLHAASQFVLTPPDPNRARRAEFPIQELGRVLIVEGNAGRSGHADIELAVWREPLRQKPDFGNPEVHGDDSVGRDGEQ